MANSDEMPSDELRTDLTSNEDERCLVEDLQEDWPAMPRKNRAFYIKHRPERVKIAGLSIDDPFIRHPDWEDQYDDSTGPDG